MLVFIDCDWYPPNPVTICRLSEKPNIWCPPRPPQLELIGGADKLAFVIGNPQTPSQFEAGLTPPSVDCLSGGLAILGNRCGFYLLGQTRSHVFFNWANPVTIFLAGANPVTWFFLEQTPSQCFWLKQTPSLCFFSWANPVTIDFAEANPVNVFRWRKFVRLDYARGKPSLSVVEFDFL